MTLQEQEAAVVPQSLLAGGADGGVPPGACLPGCVVDHDVAPGVSTAPEDVWCSRPLGAASLPINAEGAPEEALLFGLSIDIVPFSSRLAERLPHVCVQVVADQWIEALDPDGFATVIRTVEERLDAMRAAHAELVRVRAAYVAPAPDHAAAGVDGFRSEGR
ncbi:hypothetical protein [Streptomyces sp. NPDC047315]|uniref:DUF6907 domain-containing protein n=1 Tax=Streptomyces sp. NPDC047315 TaxID=3155142 RepID=UPI0033D4588F